MQNPLCDSQSTLDATTPSLLEPARLADPAFFTHPSFHPTLAKLRREDPVHWVQAWPHKGFWAVTSYDLIKQVYLDPIKFSSEVAGSLLPIDPDIHDYVAPEDYGLGLVPAFTDPPRHDDVRRQVTKKFAARVNSSQSACTKICADLIDHVIDLGECDVVADLAAPVPSHLICHIMGVPESDWDYMKMLVDMFLAGAGGPASSDAPGAEVAAQGAMQASRDALVAYVEKLVEQRKANPQDDLTSDIVAIELKGQPLTHAEVVWNIWSLIMGGFETSRNVISGGLVALIDNPEQLRLLQAEPQRLNVAVDELVRWTTPGQVNLRTATQDVQLGDKWIRKGDWLTVWPISANRDERIFANPDKLDITRYPNPHLGFGFGIHNCIGRPLALLEARTMLAAILARLQDFEIVGELVWTGTTIAMGLKSGRVAFTPR
jgi:cytochrome P450